MKKRYGIKEILKVELFDKTGESVVVFDSATTDNSPMTKHNLKQKGETKSLTTSIITQNAWIQTYTGKQFYPANPKPEMLSLIDIAHALSYITRFTGHSKYFYSVAYHSILVAEQIRLAGYSPKIALYGALHDASEAYCNDLARPLKLLLPEYKEIEDKIQSCVWEHFGLPEPTEEEYSIVKYYDDVLFVNEVQQLMRKPHDDWDLPDINNIHVPIEQIDFETVNTEYTSMVLTLLSEYEHGWQ